MVPQQELVRHRLGELGLHANAAVPVVELALYSAEGLGEDVAREGLQASQAQGHLPQVLQEPVRGLRHLTAVLAVDAGESIEHRGEGRHAAAVLRGEVGAAVEGLAVGG